MKHSTTCAGSLLAAAIGVVLAGALLAPAALGQTRPDDRAGALGAGAATVTTQPTHPNDVGGLLGVGGVAVANAVLDARESLVGVGEVTAASEPEWARSGDLGSSLVPAELSAGTDWSAIVAGACIVGLCVAAAAAAVEVVRHHGTGGRPLPH